MQINPVDDRNDLFLVDQILPNYMIESINQEPLEDIPHTKQEWQESWNRKRLLVTPDSTLEKIAEHYNSSKLLIGEAIGLDITQIDTRFWLDYDGFTCGRHLDNEGVDFVMQIYLSDAPANLGTVFYDGETVRKAFSFTKNTGYLMINNDRQMHGMEQKVPKDVQRLTSYSYFQTR